MSLTTENLVAEMVRKDKHSPCYILVIGDRMNDVYVKGRLEENCQEGCNKFVETNTVVVPGGSANAARSLSGWKGKAACLGKVGQGPIKNRFMMGDRCVFRYDNDRNDIDFDEARRNYLSTVRSFNYSAVLLSDYNKGMLTPEFISEIVTECFRKGIPCVADCKQLPEIYAGCILKCNSDYQHKYNQSLSNLVFDAEEGWRLVVTAGPLNPVIWDGAGPLGLGYYLPPVKCVNHVGAGDCFAAHLTLALAYGFSLREAACIAHSAGRVYVQHRYNRPPTLDDMVQDMSLGSVG